MLVLPTKVSQDSQFNGKSDNEIDSYLVRRCLQGDTQSYRQLYCRHQQRVRLILYQLCDPSCLNDVVQEVLNSSDRLPLDRPQVRAAFDKLYSSPDAFAQWLC
ncbi:hypothetical protein [Scytonema sp. NUACC26]|uniref:hypothetical protein n=1 Tax=Scytonema sp. NUACC26 TaxID=3140176 RepID=UPI0034DB87E8